MAVFRFHDAAGKTTDFGTIEEAEAFAREQGYVFVTRRKVMEDRPESIVYYVHSDDIAGAGVDSGDANALFRLLLMKYREWEEPRIMPVVEASSFMEN